MANPKVVIVTPTIRPERLEEFWRAWQGSGVEFIFVHDAPAIPPLNVPAVNLSWAEIDKESWGWIIPRRTAAIRSAGLLKAYQMGAEVVVCLDDDVFPGVPDHLNLLVEALEQTWQNEWVYPHPQGARGLPYNVQKKQTWLHMGAWNKNADLDAPHRLVLGERLQDLALVPAQVVAPGQFLVFSAMHFAIRRELIPAAYHLLMGSGDWDNRWNLHRFDDVWAGMCMKKICDRFDKAVSFGGPLCDHRQASDVFNNLVAEAEGIREHEKVWRKIAALPVFGDCPRCAYMVLGSHVQGLDGKANGYWERLGTAMRLWAQLFPCTGNNQQSREVPIRPGLTQYVGAQP